MPIYRGRREGTWRVTLFANGKQGEWIVEGLKEDARKFLSRKQLEIGRKPTARAIQTFSEFCTDQYEPYAKARLKADSWRTFRVYQVAALVRHFGRIPMDELSDEHVEAFVQKRLLAGLQPISINTGLRIFRTMTRWARDDLNLPVPKLRIRRLDEGKRLAKAWTNDAVRRIYMATAELAPSMVDMIHFLFDTGCRKGESIAAEWSWVSWDERMLKLPVTAEWKPKNKLERSVPLSDGLLDTLRKRERAGKHIFLNKYGVGFRYFPDLLFRAILAKAGVRGNVHMTRHTFASHFLKAQPDLALLAYVLGHSITYTTERYAHLLPEHLLRARNAVQLSPPRADWSAKTLAIDSGDSQKHRKKQH